MLVSLIRAHQRRRSEDQTEDVSKGHLEGSRGAGEEGEEEEGEEGEEGEEEGGEEEGEGDMDKGDGEGGEGGGEEEEEEEEEEGIGTLDPSISNIIRAAEKRVEQLLILTGAVRRRELMQIPRQPPEVNNSLLTASL